MVLWYNHRGCVLTWVGVGFVKRTRARREALLPRKPQQKAYVMYAIMSTCRRQFRIATFHEAQRRSIIDEKTDGRALPGGKRSKANKSRHHGCRQNHPGGNVIRRACVCVSVCWGVGGGGVQFVQQHRSTCRAGSSNVRCRCW